MPNAGSLALLGGRNEWELAPGMLKVPWYNAELLRARIKREQKVLALSQNAVVMGRCYFASEKTSEFREINECADLPSEVDVVRVRHQFSQLNDALLLRFGRLGFRIVNWIIRLPVVAQVLKQLLSNRLEESDIFDAESLFGPLIFRIFDEHVQSDQAVRELAIDAEEQTGKSRPGRRDAGISKELVSERVTEKG